MTEYRVVTDTIQQIVAKTEITYPNPLPHPDCSLVMVVWNEETRLGSLLTHLRPYFSHFVIGVQDSTDSTLEIAESFCQEGDKVIKDRHWGYGEASMPMLVREATTPWVFVVAADEWPDEDLLSSLTSAMVYAPTVQADAVWVEFKSFVEGIEYTEQHGHLRLFKQRLGWPDTLHSRPMSNRGIWWPIGSITHSRSLDEMMLDYLRYYAVGRLNAGWTHHNTAMMRDACAGVAKERGWDYVQSFEWWPQVAAIAFSKGVPNG